MNTRSKIDTYEEEEEKSNFVQFLGAEVQWPPDCSEEMLKQIIDLVKHADNKGIEDPQEIGKYLKQSMDKKYNPHWHVVCGKNFGCYAIHEARHFVFFYYGELAYLVYKAG